MKILLRVPQCVTEASPQLGGPSDTPEAAVTHLAPWCA